MRRTLLLPFLVFVWLVMLIGCTPRTTPTTPITVVEEAPAPEIVTVPPTLATIVLPDGTACRFAGTGATLAFDGKRLNYTCDSAEEVDSVLLGDVLLDGTDVTVERGRIGREAGVFVLQSTEIINATITEVELVDGSTCLFAGRGATLAFEEKRLNYTCDEAGTTGLIGSFGQQGASFTVEKVTLERDGSGFSEAASSTLNVTRLVLTTEK